MENAAGEIIYVGKAKNLKNRLTSYFSKQKNVSEKTKTLVEQIQHIQITITRTENEALILESTLIKEYRPKYNVLLRDDKSYPYIYLSTFETFPRIEIHRGTKKEKGRYFGPYPSGAAARAALNLLQKIFNIRPCSNSFFANRSRPCLQYQIKRCKAPCVGYIDEVTYHKDVHSVELFLEGKSQALINLLIKEMQQASVDLSYERAAFLRDQIQRLQKVQEQQYVVKGEQHLDVIAVVIEAQTACINFLFIRNGHMLGSKHFVIKTTTATQPEEILQAFIPQFYLNHQHIHDVPSYIILSHPLYELEWLENALSEYLGKKIVIKYHVRTQRAQWQAMALSNAKIQLQAYLSQKMHIYQRFDDLRSQLRLVSMPNRIECFDISHTMGESTVASCVVFDVQGPVKAEYRRFNIKDITPGDDYAAMYQVLYRRYTKLRDQNIPIPDIILIDGGKGQLQKAQHAMTQLQIHDVMLIAVAKGPGRKPGLETLYLEYKDKQLRLPESSPALLLIQSIRDEAHRFAITGHRQQQRKKRNVSILESIPGVGRQRRSALLARFGGLAHIKQASLDEIQKTPGVSKTLAERIYKAIHE